jgi:hypothetical protein
MTGRDLIIYILENNLEDKPVFEDGVFVGFLTEMEAAMKFDVGLSTVRLWVDLGMLEGFRIGENVYIFANAKNPIKGGANEEKK